MPDKSFLVDYRGSTQDIHRWYVFPNTSTARAVRNPLPVIEYWNMTFNSRIKSWVCNCSRGTNQFPQGTVCVHALSVFREISRKQGAWEADGSLMSTAWEVVRRNGEQEMRKERKWRDVKVEKLESSIPRIQKWNVFTYFDKGGERSRVDYIDTTREFRCSCGMERCDHVAAVLNYESDARGETTFRVYPQDRTAQYIPFLVEDSSGSRQEVLKKPGVRPASYRCSCKQSNCQHIEAVAAWEKENEKGPTLTIDDPFAINPKLISGDFLDALTYQTISAQSLNRSIEDLAKITAGMNGVFSWGVDPAAGNKDSSFLKDLRVYMDDVEITSDVKSIKLEKPEEPKEPEKPKKPKSRFSEIDL